MTSPPLPFDFELLERYLAQQCTPDERAVVESAAAADRRIAALLQTMQALPAGTYPVGPRADSQAAWTQIVQRRQTGTFQSRSSRQPSSRSMTKLSMVLGVLGALGIAGMMVLGARMPHLPRTVVQRYTTVAGQHATVTLLDGTRTLLAPSTSLIVNVTLEKQVDVRVVGEALFIVNHHEGRLFRVYTEKATARVLGTTFLVRQYDTDTQTRVVVVDGRVGVLAAHPSTRHTGSSILTAGAVATVNDSGTIHIVSHAADEYTAWTRGELVFQDTPARDAMLELGQAYGVEIRIADSTLANRPLNATILVTQQSLAAVLESLTDALGAHTVRAGRVITLVPGRHTTPRLPGPLSSFTSESHYGR